MNLGVVIGLIANFSLINSVTAIEYRFALMLITTSYAARTIWHAVHVRLVCQLKVNCSIVFICTVTWT